jgi:ssDNA-binding Zn-finger/Zn-ribbon topoisomerase 1
MIDRFSREKFESVLTHIANPLKINCVGIVGDEYRYSIPVSGNVLIYVNSSVGHDGYAATVSANSIRMWIADANGKPLAKKKQEYITRVPGWELRMEKVYQKTLETAKRIASIPVCPVCGGQMVLRTRKIDGNQFYGCKAYPRCNGSRDIEEQSEVDNLQQDNTPEELAVVSNERQYSKYQIAILAETKRMKSEPSAGKRALVICATAGSGKTTIGIEMLKLCPPHERTLFVAFNKHIAVELQKRAPAHVAVSTFHSLGYAALRRAFGSVTFDDNKVDGILNYMYDREKWKHTFPAIKQLVSLVKYELSTTNADDLMRLVDHHGIDLNGDAEMILSAVPEVISRCKRMNTVVDYDDMCWLPVVLDISCAKYDNIFIDEAQDTCKCQIALVLKSVKDNGIIMAAGDENQSLYGFRGADVDAMANLISKLNATTLPLSISYRNPKSVVRFVNEQLPYIAHEAADNAIEGCVRHIRYDDALNEFKPGDMVLCRTNAPLVSPAFSLIRRGIKAIIRGRDIGKGLVTLINKMRCSTINDLMVSLVEYKRNEVSKLLAAEKNSQAQAIDDKVDTIIALSEGVNSIDELINRINNIFSDDSEGVVFSSVHRAKGLEAQRVYILKHELMPHPMAKKEWERKQEQNIRFVAYTRSLNELIFVDGE